MKKNNSPMSDADAKDSFDFLVRTTVDILKISLDEATRRVDFLFSCGILNTINPMEREGQQIVDIVMAIPSREHKNVMRDFKAYINSKLN